ncbi:hypothetical protein [Synechococcus sp. MVIR-18-1]|uniref:hypothetical protein n=1 Tax=Synechococcus sp. MVIR-18-1 TaxID=1386941 RepID=UPI001646C4D3|nr:hypothetical protein [Synechococcus sp. MVIR-18-1]QNI75231.1 methyltransferase domain protein [Synechococcus sp. MVIR-18-1]
MDQFLIAQRLCDLGLYSSPENLIQHCDYIFSGCNFEGLNILDVGGGSGLLSMWTLLNGASSVTLLEPEFSGSTQGITSKISSLAHELGVYDRLIFYPLTIQDYLASDKVNHHFDHVVFANSINHVNEPAVESYYKSNFGSSAYIDLFSSIRKICRSNSNIFISDCSRSNVFKYLPFANPLMPSIEWNKHLNPSEWSNLLLRSGYYAVNVKWFSPNSYPALRPILGNQILNYFTFSHFSLQAKIN